MARPARADHRELLIEAAVQKLHMGNSINLGDLCRELAIAPSLANHYFADKNELVREAWIRVIHAFITDDYESLDALGQEVDWEGVEAFIFDVFSPERSSARLTHIRGLGQSASDVELGQAVHQAQRETTRRWLGLLEHYARRGVLKPKVDLQTLAILFSAIPLGVTAVHGALSESERQAMSASWLKMLRAVL